MSSQIEIINVALVRLGANTINSLSEGTTEATYANALWNVARQAALRDHPWNFAIKEVELAEAVTNDSLTYDHSFGVPTDCLRVLRVDADIDYKLQNSKLYTDKSTCKIKYIYDHEDSTKWDAAFIDTFAQRLAAELAFPITKSTSLMEAMYGVYEKKLGRTKFTDGTEDIQDQIGAGQSPFISVRY